MTVPDVTVTVSGGDPAALTSEPAAEPVTVSLSAEASSIAEAYGKTKFRIELSRALVAGEMVKVPFVIDGGKWKQDWHVKFQDAHNGPGVERTQSGRKSAVRFTEGGRVATLVLVARPNEDTEARTISIAFGTGKRAPRATGVAGGIALAGEPIAVAIIDDDLVALSVDDAKAKESKRWMRFTVRLSAKPEKPVTASFSTRSSSPVSAREGADYRKLDTRVRFAPGETQKEVKVRIFDDSHNEGPETFEVFLSRSSAGAGIADGVAVGTITNDDPLPGAWLARFGRAVAERALDGITARLAADRTPGLRGSIAGQALDFVPAASDGAELSISSGAGADPGSLSGAGEASFGQETQGQARGMTMQEVLRGSSFSLTGEADSSGGTLSFWGGTPGSGGLVSGSQFAGDQRGDGTAVGLHGETATALLGTDYARGRWLVGFALSQTQAEGGYAPIDGNVKDGGDVEASLTATIPYAALAVKDRLRLWGAAGQGAGDVTVKTGTGESLSADTAWSMAAAGLRGDLLTPAAGSETGPSLAVVSDALWVRTSSEKVSGLAASESDVSRLRLGLEGSWSVALSGGGAMTPRLELGARHDGGDAETGFGVELGGGLAWHDPKLGLRLDLSGRTLVAHDDGSLEDRGVSAQLAYDPEPASGRGLTLSLTQDWGGRPSGGLDALFAPNPLEDRTGSDEATSRWAMEAAYGLPVLGGRFTGSPHVGFGLATAARDYMLGWRLTPEENANAFDVSFGLKATRRKSDTADPEHSVGIEVGARW
ncbi:MAG: hypothetical protein F4X35_04740 [Alphaproteobacteria bacterium]|nr:hypothetical protein [Alphaproteobacteria bacterium]